jgi:hypothetical protein
MPLTECMAADSNYSAWTCKPTSINENVKFSCSLNVNIHVLLSYTMLVVLSMALNLNKFSNLTERLELMFFFPIDGISLSGLKLRCYYAELLSVTARVNLLTQSNASFSGNKRSSRRARLHLSLRSVSSVMPWPRIMEIHPEGFALVCKTMFVSVIVKWHFNTHCFYLLVYIAHNIDIEVVTLL